MYRYALQRNIGEIDGVIGLIGKSDSYYSSHILDMIEDSLTELAPNYGDLPVLIFVDKNVPKSIMSSFVQVLIKKHVKPFFSVGEKYWKKVLFPRKDVVEVAKRSVYLLFGEQQVYQSLFFCTKEVFTPPWPA